MKPKRKKAVRSAVTTNRRAFIGNNGDKHSDWYRRRLDLIGGHVSDLGGREMLSAAQISLCQRVSSLEVALELMEGRMSLGQDVDTDVYSRTASHLRRMLETLGLHRVKKDITTSIREYLAAPSPARNVVAQEGNGAAAQDAEIMPDRSVKALAREVSARMSR